jgi:hypothetical protein
MRILAPSQDILQHLAYARLLADRPDDRASILHAYDVPASFQPYFTTHYVLSGLGRLAGIQGAYALLLALYAAGIFAGLHALSSAVHRDAGHSRERHVLTAVAGSLLLWNPVSCLGLLPFQLAIPAFLFACAFFLRCTDGPNTRRRLGGLVATASALAWLHVVAAGAFAGFVALFALFSRRREAATAAAVAAGSSLGTFLLLAAVGDSGLGTLPASSLTEPMQRAHGLEFLNEVFRIKWSDPLVKLSYLLSTVLGPYRAVGQLFVAVVLFALGTVIWTQRRRQPDPEALSLHRPFARAVLGFAILCWLVPWGLGVPTEITFLDLRLMTLAFALGLALVPPALLAPQRATVAAGFAAALLLGHLGYRTLGFWREAGTALALLEKAQPRGVLVPLVFHGRSAHFGKQFHVTHFLPMHYTVQHGGITTQFWGRYTEHLPIDWRPGKKPLAPPDWRPQEFSLAHLRDANFVMIQSATEEDPEEMRLASRRVERLIARDTQRIECRGLWCLYRVIRAPGVTR